VNLALWSTTPTRQVRALGAPAAVARAFRRTAVPLAAYYAITLGLPLANGAARSGAFVDHALVVLVVPPAVIVLAAVLAGIATLARRRAPSRM
jgi:hypothetical protein